MLQMYELANWENNFVASLYEMKWLSFLKVIQSNGGARGDCIVELKPGDM